jgi:hypothetical protein
VTDGLPPTIALDGGETSASVVAVGRRWQSRNAPKLSLRETRPTPFAACTKYFMLAGGPASRPFHSRESSVVPQATGSEFVGPDFVHCARSSDVQALVPSPV